MTTTTERLQKINEIGKRNEQAKKEMWNERKEQWVKAQATIKSYAGRINELVEIANTLCANKIHLGRKGGMITSCDEFYAEGINHRLGFIAKGNIFMHDFVPVVGIGIEGGGCDGYDLVVNTEGDITKGLPTNSDPWGELSKAKKFINDFNEFERRVLGYVDSLRIK